MTMHLPVRNFTSPKTIQAFSTTVAQVTLINVSSGNRQFFLGTISGIILVEDKKGGPTYLLVETGMGTALG